MAQWTKPETHIKLRANDLENELVAVILRPETSGAASSDELPIYDYVSPGLRVVTPDLAFPNMIIGDPSVPTWPWFRSWVAHNWYVDRRDPGIGFANRDEVSILYNSALLFEGKECLEIGCWRGWSAVHLALGVGHIDIIDPILADAKFLAGVQDSGRAAGILHKMSFTAGLSPAAVHGLAEGGKRWSLIFIDGDHEADGPRLDAETVMQYAEDTAMVLFHDLASPDVAAGLDALRNAGWRTMIYQTMQIMGVAWRGAVRPVQHIPDPRIVWTLPAHLAGYYVSGWDDLPAASRRPWWPGMSAADRQESAMLRAQKAEDSRSKAFAAQARLNRRISALESEMASLMGAELRAQMAEAAGAEACAAQAALKRRLDALNSEADVLNSEVDVLTGELVGLREEKVRQERAIELFEYALLKQRQNTSLLETHKHDLQEFSVWFCSTRVLVGMLRRSHDARRASLETYLRASGSRLHLAPTVLSWLVKTRVLFGLLRRSSSIRNALLNVYFLQAGITWDFQNTTNLPVDNRRYNSMRENVLLVVHETSRTGAPILGLNIAWQLAKRYNVFTVFLGDGALTSDFKATSTEIYGPVPVAQRNITDLAIALVPLFATHRFRYAIVNSTESRCLLELCAREGVPSLFLVHEFGSYVYPAADLRRAFDFASDIVFPAQIVADSSLKIDPSLSARDIHILPQGMSKLPASDIVPNPELADKLDTLTALRRSGTLLVVAGGSVSFRKGVDLFLAVAAGVQRSPSARSIHFIWVGHGYMPHEDMAYSIYLEEQIERSSLVGKVTFLGELSDLEPVYGLADIFVLSSRLDPLPNVTIDAAHRSIPIVCFDGASGTAEFMLSDPLTAALVVPHLDTEAAACAIIDLACNDEKRSAIAAATGRLAAVTFNMETYVEQLDALGTAHSADRASGII